MAADIPAFEAPTKLAESMTALHEAFSEAVAAGFTEDQALKLVVGLAVGVRG